MSFLAFAAGAGREITKQNDEKRKQQQAIEKAKFANEHNYYLERLGDYHSQKSEHEKSLAWATMMTDNKALQKVYYNAHKARGGKDMDAWVAGTDFSSVNEENTGHLSMDFNTPPPVVTETLAKYGVTDLTKGKRDRDGVTLNDREKQFALSGSSLPAHSPLGAHYDSAVANKSNEILAQEAGVDVEEVKKTPLVEEVVSPSQVFSGLNLKPLGNRDMRKLQSLTGGTDDTAIIQSIEDDQIRRDAIKISDSLKAANEDRVWLQNSANHEKNTGVIVDPETGETSGTFSVLVSTTPEGRKYVKEGNSNWKLLASTDIELQEGDTTSFTFDQKQELRKANNGLREQRGKINQFAATGNQLYNYLEESPEAATYAAQVLKGVNSLLFEVESGFSLLSKLRTGDQAAERTFLGAYEKSLSNIEGQIRKQYGFSAEADRVLSNVKSIMQLQSRLALQSLAYDNQTGNAVANKEWERVLSDYRGNPESVKNLIGREVGLMREVLINNWNNARSAFADDLNQDRFFLMNTANSGEEFANQSASDRWATGEVQADTEITSRGKSDARMPAGETGAEPTEPSQPKAISTGDATELPNGDPLEDGKIYYLDGSKPYKWNKATKSLEIVN